MASSTLEQRVTALEAEISHLKNQLAALAINKPWWEQIAGTFADDSIYDEAMRLGRKYRESQRPNATTRQKKR